MAVVSMIVGAITPDGATFATKVDGGGPVRVAVALDAAMTSPVFTSSQAVDAQGVAKVSITGLDAATQFFWQVEDNSVLDTSITGEFLTYPPVGIATNFTLALAGDAGLSPNFPGTGATLDNNRISNSPIFDLIRTRIKNEGWLSPFIHLGDFFYYNFGVDFPGTLANYRTGWDDVLLQDNQHQLYHDVGILPFYDDHDFDGNNSDGTYPDKANVATVYRERAPHYALADANAIYQTWQIGRVLFIGADVRYNRSPNSDPDGPSKTMLGSAQKAWMEGILSTSDAKLFVWIMPQTWLSTAADSWASFATEQAEMVAMFEEHGWLGRMCIISADAHMIAIDTGTNSAGGIPLLVAAALDATPLGNPSQYDLGGFTGVDQYGTLEVEDFGSHLSVTLTGWRNSDALITHTFAVTGDPPPTLTSGALVRTITGSHRALFEARVLTTFQTGPEPEGTEIAIISGDVEMDAIAEIQRTLELTTDGNKMWPRFNDSLLAAYGNEIFVRRGVDLGASGPLWVPLGYFRIDTPEQDDSPNGPIRIGASDRMATIIDSKLLEPRLFEVGTSVGAVFDDLVLEIYPDAVILFDDSSGSSALGRDMVVERNRYQALKELADGLGKIMFWDGEGILRINTAPDPTEFVWEVNAGFMGVQIQAARSLTRVDTFNAVVATGEGADAVTPARGVAVDANPLSPTFFGGRFGKIPHFLESPLITTDSQATNAATEILRRNLGMHYNVDFRAIVNPSLTPYDPIRIRYEDGNRELHIMEKLTIPLDAETPMSGSTREQTTVVISNVI